MVHKSAQSCDRAILCNAANSHFTVLRTAAGKDLQAVQHAHQASAL